MRGKRVQPDAGPVSRLFFGRDDAETDLRDGLLKGPVFRPTYAYREALSGRKSLVIGRKGSGKSAICRHLAGPDGHPGASVLIAPDDAAGDEIRRFALQGLTPDTAKSLIWRYIFAVHAARHLTGHARAAHGRRLPGSVRAVRSFLEANGESDDARLYERLRRGIGRLQSADLSLKAFGFEAALGIGGASEGAEASRQLDVLEAGVQAVSVKGEPTSAYILRHSLPRPRDTIQFLNVCRDFADEAGNPAGPGTRSWGTALSPPRSPRPTPDSRSTGTYACSTR